MPTSKIKKDAREGKGTVKSLEKKWDKAKDAAGKDHGDQNWPLTMHIYKNMTHSAAVYDSRKPLEAVARLLATARK